MCPAGNIEILDTDTDFVHDCFFISQARHVQIQDNRSISNDWRYYLLRVSSKIDVKQSSMIADICSI